MFQSRINFSQISDDGSNVFLASHVWLPVLNIVTLEYTTSNCYTLVAGDDLNSPVVPHTLQLKSFLFNWSLLLLS